MKGEQPSRGGALQVSPFSHLDKADRAVENLKDFNFCSKNHAVKSDRKSHESLRAVFFPNSLQTILHVLFLEGYYKIGVANYFTEHIWFWDRNLQ